jgi:hypothetical protein
MGAGNTMRLTERGHVFTGPDRQEPDKGHLHTSQRPDHIPTRIRRIDPVTEPPHQNKHKHVQGYHIGDKDVSSPGGYHPSVEYGREGRVEGGTGLGGTDPEVEGEHEEEDGDGFVVVGTGDGSGDVACDILRSRV